MVVLIYPLSNTCGVSAALRLHMLIASRMESTDHARAETGMVALQISQTSHAHNRFVAASPHPTFAWLSKASAIYELPSAHSEHLPPSLSQALAPLRWKSTIWNYRIDVRQNNTVERRYL